MSVSEFRTSGTLLIKIVQPCAEYTSHTHIYAHTHTDTHTCTQTHLHTHVKNTCGHTHRTHTPGLSCGLLESRKVPTASSLRWSPGIHWNLCELCMGSQWKGKVVLSSSRGRGTVDIRESTEVELEVARDNRNSVIPPGKSGARGRSSSSSSWALLRVDLHHGLGGGSQKRREGREDEGREWEEGGREGRGRDDGRGVGKRGEWEEGREGRGREMMGGEWGREGSDNFSWLALQGLHFILLHRCLESKQV